MQHWGRTRRLISVLWLCAFLVGCASSAERLARLAAASGPVEELANVPLTTEGLAARLVTLRTRAKASQSFLLLTPDNPVASVILFAGGHGHLTLAQHAGQLTIGWGAQNFLVRSRRDFAKHGFVVAVVDAPSDRTMLGMLYGFRNSPEHVRDIEAVIAHLQTVADVPVWLIGTSRGTESAAYIAIHAHAPIGGIVLTSSMTVANRKGEPVTSLPLERITVPTMVVAHEQDACWVTPPQGAAWIAQSLINAPRVRVQYFSGGRPGTEPCQAQSSHGFLGIEPDVLAAIAAFINAGQ